MGFSSQEYWSGVLMAIGEQCWGLRGGHKPEGHGAVVNTHTHTQNIGHKHQTALLASLSKKESNDSLAEQKEIAKRQRWGDRKLIR